MLKSILNNFIWNGKSSDGQDINSQYYFFSIKTNKDVIKGKICSF